jgi:hypothetical protein
MKIMNRLKIFSLLLLVSCIAFSCDDDDNDNNGEVALLSFGPAGVQHGETIKFIGNNLDEVTAIVLAPNIEIPSSSFVSQTSELIEITVPQEAEAGKLLLKTSQGDIETKTELSFDVDVEIASVTGEAKPGTNITITGSKLNWIEEIVFPTDLVVTEFVSQSMTEVVVTVPMEAETGFITFNTGGTDPLSFSSESELVVSLPQVTSIEPSSARHTDVITLTGENLDLVQSIIFGADKTVSSFESQTATAIEVAVPAGAEKGKLTLTQASPVDVETEQELTIILPKGSSVAPRPAVPGTDNITITGTDLDLVAKLTLAGTTAPIDVLAADFISQSATQIVLALPADADNGGISYTTIHGYSNILGVSVVLPGSGPPPLTITVFDESVMYSGGNWSWGNVTESGSTEQAYAGTKSWKHTNTGGDGGASVGGMSGVNASSLGTFKFALYGGPGTDNKQVAAILNDNWGNYNSVIIKEGKWTEFSIPLTSYPGVDKSNITRWIFKMEGASAGQYFYVDYVGFDPN